jgi:hypothetical protein
MATHDIEARLCRWLLRARDLSGNDTLSFTEEILAAMLGVRRTSVTAVAHTDVELWKGARVVSRLARSDAE